jgi:hypothetical protein
MYILNFYISFGFFWKIFFVLTVSLVSGLILSLAYQMGNKESRQSSQPYSWFILIMPSMIAVIIFMVGDNFLRAVYLLGATALIRFRNPVKNPLTTIFVLATVGAGACTGFGLYGGSIALSLMCLLIVRVSCYWSTAGRGASRILHLDCHHTQQPEMVLQELKQYVKQWAPLSVEAVPGGDRFYYSYDVELAGKHDPAVIIARFKNAGINVHLIEPQGMEEF